MMKLLVRGAGQIVTVVENGSQFLAGKDMANIAVRKAGKTGLSVAVNNTGYIAMIGTDEEVISSFIAKNQVDQSTCTKYQCTMLPRKFGTQNRASGVLSQDSCQYQ